MFKRTLRQDRVTFGESLKKADIWNKGQVIAGYDPRRYRRDAYGSLIIYEEYGQNSRFGWHFDHIIEKALGGSNLTVNLRPLHWYNNTRRGGILGGILRNTRRGAIPNGVLRR